MIEAALQEPLHALEAEGGMVVLTRNDGETAEVVRTVGEQPDGARRTRSSASQARAPLPMPSDAALQSSSIGKTPRPRNTASSIAA